MAELKLGAGLPYGNWRRTRVSGEQIAEAAAAQSRVAAGKVGGVPLTPLLIEGFTRTYLLDRFDNPAPIPAFHRELWANYCGEHTLGADAAPRGHAKSTAVTHTCTLADCLFRNTDFTTIVSNTWAQGVEFLRDIKSELSENDKIVRDFNIAKFVKDSEDDVIVAFKDGHKFRITVRGVEQKIRGLKWGHKRPGKFLLDDIEDDEQVENQDRREKLSKWVMKALLPAGSDYAKTRLYGTVMHFDSFLENALKSSEWVGKRYKAHKSFDDFSEILWPEKFPESRLRQLRQLYIAKGEADGYSQEYLNHPISEQTAYFKRQNLLPLPPEIVEQIVARRLPLNIYIGWDFAVSKDQRADYTRFVVVGVDSRGWKFVLAMGGGRWDTKEIVDKLFQLEREYSPAFHAVEKGVIDKSLGPWIEANSSVTHIYPALYKINPSLDKRARARPFQGATEAHHVFFNHAHPEWPGLLDELTKFPKGEHDDYVDACSNIGMLLQDMHSAPTEAEQADYDEAEILALNRARRAAAPVGRNRVTGY